LNAAFIPGEKTALDILLTHALSTSHVVAPGARIVGIAATSCARPAHRGERRTIDAPGIGATGRILFTDAVLHIELMTAWRGIDQTAGARARAFPGTCGRVFSRTAAPISTLAGTIIGATAGALAAGTTSVSTK